MTASRSFRAQPEAVTAARQFVREILDDLPTETVDQAELMASELATNCVRHARSDFELVIHRDGEVRVELSDTGAGEPRALSPTRHELTGRGLRIVQALSDAWGIVPGSPGKTVWFTLAPAGVHGEDSASAHAGGEPATPRPRAGKAAACARDGHGGHGSGQPRGHGRCGWRARRGSDAPARRVRPSMGRRLRGCRVGRARAVRLR